MAFFNNKKEDESREDNNKLTLEDVRNNNHPINDSFNKALKEIREKTKDESNIQKLLTRRVLEGFLLTFSEANKQKQKQKEKESDKVIASPLGVDIPKNKGKVPEDENKGLEDENKETKKPRRSEKPKKNMNVRVSIPNMPQEFKDCIEKMNGTDVMFLIQKKLTKSDTEKQQNRLSMPIRQIKDLQFLKEEEKKELDKKEKIAVSLIEPSLKVRNLNLKKWPTSGSYTLIGEWSKVVEDNEEVLKEDAIVQVWSFRQGLELCFALINITDDKDDSGASCGGNGN